MHFKFLKIDDQLTFDLEDLQYNSQINNQKFALQSHSKDEKEKNFMVIMDQEAQQYKIQDSANNIYTKDYQNHLLELHMNHDISEVFVKNPTENYIESTFIKGADDNAQLQLTAQGPILDIDGVLIS